MDRCASLDVAIAEDGRHGHARYLLSATAEYGSSAQCHAGNEHNADAASHDGRERAIAQSRDRVIRQHAVRRVLRSVEEAVVFGYALEAVG